MTDTSGSADADYLDEFYRHSLERQALDPVVEERFRVDFDEAKVRASDQIQPLIRRIARSGGSSVTLLSGGRGAGKSSALLTTLRQAAAADGMGFLYVDIGPYHWANAPVEPAPMLVMIAAAAVEALSLKPGAIDHRTPWQKLRQFFDRFELTGLDVGLGAQASGWTVVPGFSADLRLALEEDASGRRQVQDFLARNPRQFREDLHEIVTTVFAALPGRGSPIFVVDSLDHIRGGRDNYQAVRESLDGLFSRTWDDFLRLPQAHTVYCVPGYIQGTDSSARFALLHIKVREPDGSPYAPGLEALREVLVKRAPGGDIERLLGDHVDEVIHFSGGNIRNLLQLVCAIIDETGDDDPLPVSAAAVTAAERRLRESISAGLYQEHFGILRRVRDSGLTGRHFQPTLEGEAERTDYLEACGALLRYTNGDTFWYAVHPLLDAFL